MTEQKTEKINFSLDCDPLLKARLEEYAKRKKLTHDQIFAEALTYLLETSIDSSFEGWYSYLIKEEHLSPDKAEEEAYHNTLGNQFVPEVKYPEYSIPKDILF